jgi:hypothetical protein
MKISDTIRYDIKKTSIDMVDTIFISIPFFRYLSINSLGANPAENCGVGESKGPFGVADGIPGAQNGQG